jgi:hypothetical protein
MPAWENRRRAFAVCVVVVVVLASIPGSSEASSGATFTLGLSAEYLSDSQDYDGGSAKRSNLQTIIWLAAAGHLIDPRFMTFDASVAKTLSDQTISGQPDNEVDDTYFDGALRFFNNRAVSFEVGAGRQGTDVTGLPQGAIVDGVRDYQRYGLRALGGRWFRLNLRRWEQSFTADQPDTLRDEDTSWSELSTQAVVGKVDALLQLLWKENDLFGGGLQQEIGSGRLDIDINRNGKLYWHTDFIGNAYRSARDHGEFSPWTTNYLFRNQLRHRYSQLGFWDLRADLRVVRVETDPVEEITTGNASANVVAPLSPSAFLEGELGYLSNEFGDGLRLSQPRAGLGLRWGKQFGRWWLSIYPRVTYIRADPEEFEQESSLGSLIFGSVRYQLQRSSVTFEAEYFDNQLAIPDYTVGDAPIGSAFLAGLDRRRYRGRLIFEVRPSRRTAFSIEGDYRNRVRVDRGNEIEEDLARAQLNIALGPVTISASGDRFELVGSEVPTLTDVWQATVTWGPTYWLMFDAFVRSEEREVFDYVGQYEFAEAGVRFNYAKLSFYARVREQRTEEAGLEQRKFRRVWVGVRRLFNFRVGDQRR